MTSHCNPPSQSPHLHGTEYPYFQDPYVETSSHDFEPGYHTLPSGATYFVDHKDYVQSRRSGTACPRRQSITFEEQRHEPPEGFSITPTTRPLSSATIAMRDLTARPRSSEPLSRPDGMLNYKLHSIQGSKSESALFIDDLHSARRSRSNSAFDSVAERASTLAGSANTPLLEEAVEIKRERKAGDGDLNEELDESGEKYPGPLALFFLLTGICLSVFLISIDRTIITTAIPFITLEFNSSTQVGWYGSAYLLTASAFQPLYGRIFQLFSIKWSYIIAMSIFELGSLLCGISPDSVTLIIGRAIAGLGSAGLLTGSFVVVAHAVPLRTRPVWTAVVGLMFGFGATLGPLLGGVFTELSTWRWCFYFNLPIGGVTLFTMAFFHPPKQHGLMNKSFFYRVTELDILGNVILLSASVMLFTALEFTEDGSVWKSARIIGLLTGSGITFIVFCVWQWWKAEAALIPPRIIGQRTVAASCAVAFFLYSAILIQTYFLPIWFQAIQGDSAIISGVHMIPYVLANAMFTLIAGVYVSKGVYFALPALIGTAIGTVGCGLLTTFGVDTGVGKWVGFEIITSAGFGMAIQQGFTAVQIVLPLEDVAIGTAAVVAFQSLGGAIFVSVGNTILQDTLLGAADDSAFSGVDIHAVVKTGAMSLKQHASGAALSSLLVLYNKALQKVFTAAIPMAGLAFLSCFFLEWRRVGKIKHASDEETLESRGRREYR